MESPASPRIDRFMTSSYAREIRESSSHIEGTLKCRADVEELDDALRVGGDDGEVSAGEDR
jgi:hypothetical protein